MLLINLKSHAAIFIASALVGLNFGGIFALFPSATSDYFGAKHFGINYGWIFTAYGVAGIIGPILGGAVFDMTGSYILAFSPAGIACFAAAGLAFIVDRPKVSDATA